MEQTLKYDTTYKGKLLQSGKEHCDVSSCMYYLKFTFKGPDYSRKIVFFMILLQIFSKNKKFSDCFFSN